MRERLTVFPPGTTAAERRAVIRYSVRLIVITVAGSGGASSYGNVRSMSTARSAFESLDARARDEDLAPAQYEREWACIFQAVKTQGAALSGELRRGNGQASDQPGVLTTGRVPSTTGEERMLPRLPSDRGQIGPV